MAVLAPLMGAVGLSGCGGRPTNGEPISVSSVMGGLGEAPGRFGYPRGIDTTPPGVGLGGTSGVVWVVDKTGRIQGIDAASGKCLAIWKMPETDRGKPVGLTVAPGPDEHGDWCDELLYVADTHYHRVMVYRPTLRPEEGGPSTPVLVRSFGSYGTEPGQFRYPTDVAVLVGEDGRSIERIYVSEYGGNDRISVFDGEGGFLMSFGRFGAGGGTEFDRPQAMLIETIAGRSELIVADSRNHRVGRFTLDGDLIAWYGDRARPGDDPGAFRYPWGLASLGDGTALVVEYGNNRVQRIDLATGAGLGTWGRAGRGEGELAAPWGIGILGRTAFVLDTGNNRVQGFAAPARRRS